MKRTSLLVFLIWLAASAWAGRVGEQTALKKASAFMSKHARTRGAGTLTRVYLPLETKSPIWSTTDAPLYVFNNDGGGFVVVSGDDRTADILCFSDRGHIDANNLPVNMKSWLQGYVRQIESIPASAVPQRVATTRTGDTKEPLETKLKTAWDQNYPYNLHTPELIFSWQDTEKNVHAATGCVATAMAMILHYFKYPSELKDSIHSYEGTCDIPVSNQETGEKDTIKNVKWQTEDIPAGTPILWGYIRDKYDNQSSEEEKDAIARLMQYCGAAANMDYGIESSAFTGGLLHAMNYVMDYQDAFVLNAFEYDEQGWIDAVYYEMSKVGPVMFAGTAPSSGGHRFILDGYQSVDDKDYFYVNWGWSGSDNCYALLSVMEPESQWIKDEYGNPEGFINEQDMICGLGPDGKGCTTVPNLKFYANDLQLGLEGKEYSRIDKSEPFLVTDFYLQFANYHLSELTSKCAVGVYDANNNLVTRTNMSDEEGSTLEFFYYIFVNSDPSQQSDTFPIGGNLNDGVYTLMLVCSEPYTNNWEPMQNAEKLAVQMTVTGNTCTFKPAGTTSIRNIVADAERVNTNSAWYSLSGARLPANPRAKGIYIHNGKKYIK